MMSGGLERAMVLAALGQTNSQKKNSFDDRRIDERAFIAAAGARRRQKKTGCPHPK
jgi:hypothetical protein